MANAVDPVPPPQANPPHFPPTPLAWRLGIWVAIIALGVSAYLLRDTLGQRGVAAVGVVCFIAVVAAFSSNLRAVNWYTILTGLALQIALALFILKFGWTRDIAPEKIHQHQVQRAVAAVGAGPLGSLHALPAIQLEPARTYSYRPGFEFFRAVGKVVEQFLDFTNKGSEFVFGALASKTQMDKVFGPANSFVFAFKALPTIIFVSSFFTVLYYFGVLQFIVRIFAKGMMYLMGTSGAETLSGVANVFMGQTEAPLIVKPYVPGMTQSEMLAMMVGGMATISGGVMAVYIQLGADPVAILATSVMAAPCGLYLSKLLLPELEEPETRGTVKTKVEQVHRNVVDAAAGGASDGLSLALNVAAMLIAFLAFIALFDHLLGLIPMETVSAWLNGKFDWGISPKPMSLERIFSWVFSPVAFLMGASSKDIPGLADLLGTKLVANEFVAYIKLTSADGYRDVLTRRGAILATYALTGFANIASIGIQIGGIGGLAPSRRGDLARLGTRALLAGFIATLVNASLAGILLEDER